MYTIYNLWFNTKCLSLLSNRKFSCSIHDYSFRKALNTSYSSGFVCFSVSCCTGNIYVNSLHISDLQFTSPASDLTQHTISETSSTGTEIFQLTAQYGSETTPMVFTFVTVPDVSPLYVILTFFIFPVVRPLYMILTFSFSLL